mmetsp:Transcript_23420/g.59754  ORF Transcript_23420/g.59754 Transcript_23420/m.59754 type:complete len:204 (-) Transcript_23420:199-810(-)
MHMPYAHVELQASSTVLLCHAELCLIETSSCSADLSAHGHLYLVSMFKTCAEGMCALGMSALPSKCGPSPRRVLAGLMQQPAPPARRHVHISSARTKRGASAGDRTKLPLSTASNQSGGRGFARRAPSKGTATHLQACTDCRRASGQQQLPQSDQVILIDLRSQRNVQLVRFLGSRLKTPMAELSLHEVEPAPWSAQGCCLPS